MAHVRHAQARDRRERAEGAKIIEQWRAERKLHLSTFIKMLKVWGIPTDDEVMELKILGGFRTRVVHEDYHLNKQQALRAYDTVKRFVNRYYPNLVIDS